MKIIKFEPGANPIKKLKNYFLEVLVKLIGVIKGRHVVVQTFHLIQDQFICH